MFTNVHGYLFTVMTFDCNGFCIGKTKDMTVHVLDVTSGM